MREHEMTVERRGTYRTKISYDENGNPEKEELDEVINDEEFITIKVDGREFDSFQEAEDYATTGLTRLQRKILNSIESQKGTMYAVMEERFIRDDHSNSAILEIKEKLGIESEDEAIDRCKEIAELIGENLEQHLRNNHFEMDNFRVWAGMSQYVTPEVEEK